jgi:SAM-dependent methyltransferase
MPELSYSKVCELEDFSDPSFLATFREVFRHEVKRYGRDFPRGREHRKRWEVVMAARALNAGGVLSSDAEVLGVGAGDESTLFWLTTRVRRVFATDLYLDPTNWQETASASMMIDPGQFWSGAWNPRRLVVQHMDARDLRYEDASFDAIFSSSALEHFGAIQDVMRSMDEMFRVLRAGGILSVSTEYRLEGPPSGIEGAVLFDRRQLEDIVLGSRPWQLLSPLDTDISAATLGTAQYLPDVLARRGGEPDYPHIVLTTGAATWTSVHLALLKD